MKELRHANSALVDAFEKAKKRQLAEKRRMKHELVTYMNRVQANGAGGAIEVGLNFDVGTSTQAPFHLLLQTGMSSKSLRAPKNCFALNASINKGDSLNKQCVEIT